MIQLVLLKNWNLFSKDDNKLRKLKMTSLSHKKIIFIQLNIWQSHCFHRDGFNYPIEKWKSPTIERVENSRIGEYVFRPFETIIFTLVVSSLLSDLNIQVKMASNIIRPIDEKKSAQPKIPPFSDFIFGKTTK